jgi:hypothetical protein
MVEVHYYLAGRLLLVDVGDPPRRGDEVGLFDAVYEAVRVVWHRPMCPPDVVRVHLALRQGEAIMLGA